MPFDLAVFAVAPGSDEATIRALIHECYERMDHVEGDIDERIMRFYEELCAVYPDHPPYDQNSPWSSTPLSTAIDHVIMHIRWSADNEVIHVVGRLAERHDLVLYDPQGDTIYVPSSWVVQQG
jgi:hypothetical protein